MVHVDAETDPSFPKCMITVGLRDHCVAPGQLKSLVEITNSVVDPVEPDACKVHVCFDAHTSDRDQDLAAYGLLQIQAVCGVPKDVQYRTIIRPFRRRGQTN